MNQGQPCITGVGSVSPFGPLKGLLPRKDIQPRAIAAWPTDGLRRAFLVEPFRPAEVVPGLKTRRLDRLSVWCLVAASLAIEDARLNLAVEDRSRVAVVLGTGFGCIELAEGFFQSMAANGYAHADPISFPESLANSPASHVARVLGIRGPNITLTHKHVSGEQAIIQASALLRSGQADVAIVLTGDVLTRTMYEWFEAASLLSQACFREVPAPAPFSADRDGFVPGEGATAVVMESAERAGKRGAKVYAGFQSGFVTSDSKAGVSLARRALGSSSLDDIGLIVASANGSRVLDSVEQAVIREAFGAGPPVIAPKASLGECDSNGLLRLIAGLSWSERSTHSLAILLGSTPTGVCAALSFELG